MPNIARYAFRIAAALLTVGILVIGTFLVLVAIPDLAGTTAVKPSPTASPRREPERKPKASPSAPTLTQSDVQSKFRTVSREYNAFKRDFGPRLESEWNDIVELVTYGGADKLSRVDALLDRLRKQMSQIRKDQG